MEPVLGCVQSKMWQSMSIFAIPQELSTFSFTTAGYGKNQFDAVLPQYRSEEPNEPYRVTAKSSF